MEVYSGQPGDTIIGYGGECATKPPLEATDMAERQIWDLWYPNAAAQGLSFTLERLDASDAILVHAPPETLRVEVRSESGALPATGDQLARTADRPMARLRRQGDHIAREDLWPESQDAGRPVILPGGMPTKSASCSTGGTQRTDTSGAGRLSSITTGSAGRQMEEMP
jgi:hypothetical protein